MRYVHVLLIGIVLLSSTTVSAAPPLVERLPAKSLAYIGWAGDVGAMDDAAIGELMALPQVDQLKKVLRQAIVDHAPPHESKSLPLLWDAVEIAIRHPIAVSLLDVQPGRKGPKPQVVMLIDLGKDRVAFATKLDAFLKISEAPLSSSEEDLDYRMISTPAGMACFGYMGNVFYLTVGETGMPRLINAVKPAASLKTNKIFADAVAGVDGPALQYVAYLDVKAAAAVADKFVPPLRRDRRRPQQQDDAAADDEADADAQPAPQPVTDALKALGLGKATTAVTSMQYRGKAIYSKTHVASPAPHTGILTMLAGRPVTAADMAVIPVDADIAVVSTTSPRVMWNEAIKIGHTLSQGEVPPADKINEMILEETGISVDKDILAHLGDRWTLCTAGSLGGPMTGSMMTVEVRNGAALDASLKKLVSNWAAVGAKRPAATTRSARRRGGKPAVLLATSAGDVKVNYVAFNAPVPVSPAWAIHDGRLYVALFPQVIATAVGEKSKSLSTLPAYTGARAKVAANASTVSYVNVPKMLRESYMFYAMGWTLAANAARAEGVPLRPDWLPPLSHLEKLVSPQISAVTVDATGLTAEDSQTLPAPLIGSNVATVAVGTAILVPVINSALTDAKRSGSQANLKSIGTGVLEYARANDGKRPPNWAALVDAGYVPVTGFKSPFSEGPAPRMLDGRVVGSSYVMITYPRLDDVRPNLMLAYDKDALESEGETAILTVSGNVFWTDAMSFERYHQQAIREVARQNRRKDD